MIDALLCVLPHSKFSPQTASAIFGLIPRWLKLSLCQYSDRSKHFHCRCKSAPLTRMELLHCCEDEGWQAERGRRR